MYCNWFSGVLVFQYQTLSFYGPRLDWLRAHHEAATSTGVLNFEKKHNKAQLFDGNCPSQNQSEIDVDMSARI